METHLFLSVENFVDIDNFDRSGNNDKNGEPRNKIVYGLYYKYIF